jgi:hypothetical protein
MSEFQIARAEALIKEAFEVLGRIEIELDIIAGVLNSRTVEKAA